MNAFDQKVFALCITVSGSIIRPIRFIVKAEVDRLGHRVQVGNVAYVLQPNEVIPIIFMGAFQLGDWIFCLEKPMQNVGEPMICAFYKGQQHCNFGPIKTDDPLTEFFEFFDEKILK